MSQHIFNRTTFINACHSGGPFRTTLALDDEEREDYDSLLLETIASGNVFILDQAVYNGSAEEFRKPLMEIGKEFIDARKFIGDPMFLYFGNSEEADAAAMAFLVVEPPEDLPEDIAETDPMPMFMAYAVSEDGFILCGIGQFQGEGVGLQVFRESSNTEADKAVMGFMCGAVYHAYTQALGLMATGALQLAKQDAADAAAEKTDG